MKKVLLAAAMVAAMFSSCSEQKSGAKLETKLDTISYAMGAYRAIPADQVNQVLTQIGSDSAYVKDFLLGIEDAVNTASDKRKMAYMMGTQFGLSIHDMKSGIEKQFFANDSTKEFNAQLMLAGIKDAMQNMNLLKNAEGAPLQQQEIGMMVQKFLMELDAQNKAEMYGENKAASEKFMTEIAKKEGVKQLGEGVYYKVIKEGNGKKLANGETMKLKYEGRKINDEVFDSSYKRGDGTAQFPVGVGRVVPGFDLALQNIDLGATWEVYMAADKAYGQEGNQGIEPFSALIFKIEAIEKVADKK